MNGVERILKAVGLINTSSAMDYLIVRSHRFRAPLNNQGVWKVRGKHLLNILIFQDYIIPFRRERAPKCLILNIYCLTSIYLARHTPSTLIYA